MKFIGILLSIILLTSCQLKEEQNTDARSDNSASVNIEEFKTLFPTIEWTSDTFHIHHNILKLIWNNKLNIRNKEEYFNICHDFK